MWQYIDFWDNTLGSHLQIGLKNFPFEERIEQPPSAKIPSWESLAFKHCNISLYKTEELPKF